MVDGRKADAWSRTSELIAAIVNSNPYRDRNYTAAQFNPYCDDGRPRAPMRTPTISDEQALAIFEKCWGVDMSTLPTRSTTRSTRT